MDVLNATELDPYTLLNGQFYVICLLQRFFFLSGLSLDGSSDHEGLEMSWPQRKHSPDMTCRLSEPLEVVSLACTCSESLAGYSYSN